MKGRASTDMVAMHAHSAQPACSLNLLFFGHLRPLCDTIVAHRTMPVVSPDAGKSARATAKCRSLQAHLHLCVKHICNGLDSVLAKAKNGEIASLKAPQSI